MCCVESSSTTVSMNMISSSSLKNYSNAPIAITSLSSNEIKPLNLQGGQCTWCGKYGHKRPVCPLLK